MGRGEAGDEESTHCPRAHDGSSLCERPITLDRPLYACTYLRDWQRFERILKSNDNAAGVRFMQECPRDDAIDRLLNENRLSERGVNYVSTNVSTGRGDTGDRRTFARLGRDPNDRPTSPVAGC
jgi:hypothetical protein